MQLQYVVVVLPSSRPLLTYVRYLLSCLVYVVKTDGWFAATAEKRQADEPLSSAAEEPRKKKIDGDVPSSVVAEILEVTSDPKKMLGPDVRVYYLIV